MKKKGRVLQLTPGLIDERFLNESISNSPNYNIKYKSAIERIIKCIHGLERFHKKTSRDQIEIYIGRSTKSTLKNRWTEHMNKKHHTHGLILFTCSHEWVEDLEKIGIKVLKKLKDNEMLCVKDIKNVTTSKRGKKPKKEDAIVYMTWRDTHSSTKWQKPTIENIRKISEEIYYETRDEIKITKKQINNGLQNLKSLTSFDTLISYGT